jgi:hypothetical protein
MMNKTKHMAQQTAVDWLFEQIPVEWTSTKYAFDAYKQAKEMEKEQHSTTWLDSTMQFDNAAEMTYKKDFEQYYNETFNK